MSLNTTPLVTLSILSSSSSIRISAMQTYFQTIQIFSKNRYEQVTRKDEDYVCGETSDEDGCGVEEKERKTELSGKETHNGAVWRQLVRYIDPE